MANSKEKRHKVRIPFIYGIEFDDADDAIVLHDHSNLKSGTRITLKDVSQDGVQIASAEPLTQGRELTILIRFPRWRGVPKDVEVENTKCQVHAVVRWVSKHPAEKYYRIGLGFTKLTPSDRQIINRYLDENILVDDELLN